MSEVVLLNDHTQSELTSFTLDPLEATVAIIGYCDIDSMYRRQQLPYTQTKPFFL